MARIEKVNAELIPMALELRREMLGVIRERGEERFEGKFSDLTEDFLKNGDQTTVLAFDKENLIGCATICYIEVMPTVDHPTGKRAHNNECVCAPGISQARYRPRNAELYFR